MSGEILKVLLLSQFYWPVAGGAELHVRNLAMGLSRRGHQVTIATLAQQGSPALELDGPVQVHRVDGWLQRLPMLFTPGIPRSAAPLPDPGVASSILRIVRDERPDIVHAHDWLMHSYLPVAPFLAPPLVASLHNFGVACPKHSLIRNGELCSGPGVEKCLRCAARHYGAARGAATCVSLWTMSPLQRRAVRQFLPVSEDVARGNRLQESGLPYTVIPNFVPDDVAEPSKDAVSAARELPAEPFLLFVGALSRAKGLHILFDAYRRLSNPPPLVVIGFTARDTQDVLVGAPAGTVIRRSWEHGAVMEAWRRCAVGVVPSTWREPCPTVVIEAMAVGVPLVASALGGIPEIIEDGVSGLLVPDMDGRSLAAALGRLLGDEALRQRLGQAARERSEGFLASSVIPRVEAAYRSALRDGDVDGRQRGMR